MNAPSSIFTKVDVRINELIDTTSLGLFGSEYTHFSNALVIFIIPSFIANKPVLWL